LYLSAVHRLWNFRIRVGLKHACGSYINDIPIGNTKAFTCEPNARGNSLKIQIKERREVLSLCEVLIFGTGMVEENRWITLNNNYL